jgi:hypothetical protein
MKISTSLISFLVLAHLFIIDGIFLLVATEPSLDYLVLISYNAIWLFVAFRIWNFSYHKNHETKGL